MYLLDTFLWAVPARFQSSARPPHLHHLDLQVFVKRWRHPDGLQHLAEQLLVQELRLTSHEPVLTQQLLFGHKAEGGAGISFLSGVTAVLT